MSQLQNIPLNRLVVSHVNVRKTDRKADVAALAASIASHGLLQNLSVSAEEDGKFSVVAGGRRLAALKMLAKSGAIAKDFAVPCQVLAKEAASETSLAENVHRVAMDPMDEADAFATLREKGSAVDEIARRFGVTVRHVDQRLALARLSPKVKAAWKRRDLTLDAARAFCLVDDHARQEAVFKSLGKPVTHAASVRARLMEGRIRSSDRLVKFVGLEAYELAGGAVTRDLFEVDATYICDPALVARMAEEKLESERQTWLDLGWGWVDIHLAQGRAESYASSRVQPAWREATPEEEAEIQRLQSEIDMLDEALDMDSVEDDARWETRDTLAGQLEMVRQAARIWPAELIGHAGVALSVDHDGRASATCGLVRREDEKTVRALLVKNLRDKTESVDAPDSSLRQAAGASEIDLPKTVIRDLSQARTRAIRSSLAQRPDTALAVAVAAIALRSEFKRELSGVGLLVQAACVQDDETFAATHAAAIAGLPQDEGGVLAWCLSQSVGDLLQLLAIFTSALIDFTHEKGAPVDCARRASADCLAMALDVDMRAHWRADAAYWSRLSKAQLLGILRTAQDIEELPDAKREGVLNAFAKLKRDELAAKVEAAFEGTTYLPELLVTPTAPGALEVTESGYAAIAAE